MSHEIVKAYIFSGGEYIDDTSIVELEWTFAGILDLLKRCYMDYEVEAMCENMYADPTPITDTIQKVSEGMYQAVECSCDGGMIYIVRIYD